MTGDDFWARHVQPDWAKASPGEVALSAVKHLGPSIAHDVPQAVKGMFDYKSLGNLALGLGSKYTPARYFETPQQRAKVEAPLDALLKSYQQRYMTTPGLKEAIATDPAGVLMDISGIATLPAGGEGLAAMAPGAAGSAARVATQTARGIAKATNPVSLSGEVLARGAQGARSMLRGPIIDRSGNLSPAAQAAIAKVAPSLGPQELSDPALKASMVKAFQAKGLTPEAATEGLLDYHGIQSPRSLTTGKAPPRAAQGTADKLTAAARQKLAETAKDIAGGDAPSPHALGAALEQAQIEANNNMHGLYKRAFAHPGAFDPSFTDDLGKTIGAALSKHDLPANLNEFSEYPSFEQAPKALDWLTNHARKLADQGELTAPNLERMRQELVQFGNKAEGTDSKAVRSIIEGLDKHIEAQANAGEFSGGDGPAFASDMKAARQAFRGYQANFRNTDNDIHATVAKAVKSLAPDQAKDASSGLITATAPEGSAAAAQGALMSKLINPKTLATPPGVEKMYGRLVDILGNGSEGHQALNDVLRQAVLASDENGLLASPDKLNGFMKSPLADQVFTPEEISRIRLLSAANDVVSAKPKGSLSASLGETLGHSMRQGIGALAGEHLGPAIGIPQPLATVAGIAADPVASAVRGKLQDVAEGAGAKPDMRALRTLEGVGNLVSRVGDAAPVGRQATAARDAQDAQQAPAPTPPPAAAAKDFDWGAHVMADDDQSASDRPERASGGRVDDARVEQLVFRLMARAKAAKKAESDRTKPLLKSSDDAVAHALGVAQRAI